MYHICCHIRYIAVAPYPPFSWHIQDQMGASIRWSSGSLAQALSKTLPRRFGWRPSHQSFTIIYPSSIMAGCSFRPTRKISRNGLKIKDICESELHDKAFIFFARRLLAASAHRSALPSFHLAMNKVSGL